MAESIEQPESLEIIDLDELDLEYENEETWLVNTAKDEADNGKSWKKWNMSDDPEVRMKKRSLVEKLDFIAKGSPTRYFGSRPPMSSTPVHNRAPPPQSKFDTTQTKFESKFDPRTFTRRPSRNLTFDKETADLLADLSLDKNPEEQWKNSTFTRKTSRFSRDSSEMLDDDRISLASSDNSTSHRLNDVGDVQNLARLQEESKKFIKIIYECC